MAFFRAGETANITKKVPAGSAVTEEIVEDTGAEVSVTTTLGAKEDEYDVFGQMSKQFEMY